MQKSAIFNIRTIKAKLGRTGLSVADYDIELVTIIDGAGGQLAYGASPHDGLGRPVLGARGRPLILVSTLAITDLRTAIVTIFHEIAHHESFRAKGHGGFEADAERHGEQMYEIFDRRWN